MPCTECAPGVPHPILAVEALGGVRCGTGLAASASRALPGGVMKSPYGMAPDAMVRIGKLRSEVRDRVLERSAILIFDAGLSPHEADERALAEEAGVATQRELVR